jgi:hypothetical protein
MKPAPLLMPGCNVANFGVGQAAVKLDGMHTRNAKNSVDSVIAENFDQYFSASSHDKAPPKAHFSRPPPGRGDLTIDCLFQNRFLDTLVSGRPTP